MRLRLADPLDFDAKCDGSLPLEQMIKYDAPLRQLFKDIDRSKVRVWALTNAYRTVRRLPSLPRSETSSRASRSSDYVSWLPPYSTPSEYYEFWAWTTR